MAYTRIAAVEDVSKGIMKKFDIGDLEITVANVEDNFYAFEDGCPHMNSPLHQGKLEEKEVVCPLHKAWFDVTTGKKTADPRMPILKALKTGAMMAGIRMHNLTALLLKLKTVPFLSNTDRGMPLFS